jgi:hypothetical protein
MIYYFHIPKTGGQTLGARLASAFTLNESLNKNDWLVYPRDVNKLRQLQATKIFVESHMIGRMLSDMPAMDVIVTIRDPIDQMLSIWKMLRRSPDSQWYRAVNTLDPGRFFDVAEGYFRDFQSRYFVSGYVDLDRDIHRYGYYDAIYRQLLELTKKVRWLVPTTAIDEFVFLWSLETKRRTPNKNTLNVAPPDAAAETARQALCARPHLYAFDALFHQIAKDRFLDYRRMVEDTIAPWSYPDDSRRAYFSEGSGVWLTENWHDPEISEGKTAWWAGPGCRSNIRVRRARGEKYLRFDILVWNGVTIDDLSVVAKSDFHSIDVIKMTGPSIVAFWLSLESLGDDDELVVMVPHCLPSIATTKNDNSLVRRSFLASNFALHNEHPGQ